jgi:hypothetical protein
LPGQARRNHGHLDGKSRPRAVLLQETCLKSKGKYYARFLFNLELCRFLLFIFSLYIHLLQRMI